jgi:hypothetical protein
MSGDHAIAVTAGHRGIGEVAGSAAKFAFVVAFRTD